MADVKVVMLDLDGTIIDGEYRVTDQSVFAAISDAQQKGWQVGLNSDTALIPLWGWHSQLGMNGPVIAERGAVVDLGDKHPISEDRFIAFFAGLRQRVAAYLLSQGVAFYHGDVTQVIRNETTFPGLVEPEIVLVQMYRQCSFNLYAKKIGEQGELVNDEPLLARISSQVRWMIEGDPPPFDVLEDYNPSYGIAIWSPREVAKRSGMLKLRELLDPDQLVMVGNSMSDWVGEDFRHYAVGNANPEFKAKADYVSSLGHAAGVSDILARLTR